jgi:DinB family protein
MATSHDETCAPAWSIRLATDLTANDETARNLVSGFTDEQLNWQPTPGFWSIGQCLEHLCVTNESYLPPISAALREKSRSPVEEITQGWFAGWFIRSFAEPSPNSKRVTAPGKIRPRPRTDLSVLDRFLSGNQACRDLILRARGNDVNRIRFWSPILPGLRFTVGTGLQIVVSHERRHLLQAKRVKDSASFPR